jgi:membrane-bound serine protease (ClpP class)
VFFILEALVVSFGVLAIGGVTAMVLGSLMLMKTNAEFLQISWSVIVPVVAAAAGLSLLIVGVGLRALRRKPMTGLEEMIGLVGEAKTTVAPRGQIAIHGELWDAVSEAPLQPGDAAEVTRVEGLRLHVKPVLRRKEA